mgnify:CR=1 FL=1
MNELREKVRHNYSSNTWGSASSGQGEHAEEVKKERILKRHKSEVWFTMTDFSFRLLTARVAS